MKTLLLLCCLNLPVSWGATPSAGAKRPIKFAVLGDVHIGLHGADHGFKMTGSSERIFELAIEQLNRMDDISFVVFAGDLVLDGESFNLSRFKEIADQLKPPYFVVLGNHDQPIIPSPQAWSRETRAVYPGETKASVAALFHGHGFGPDGLTWWSADIAGVHLVGLDTAQIKTWSGVIPRQEMDWLKKNLSATRSKPALVFMHHNLIESYPEYRLWREFLVDNREVVKSTLASFPQVQAVISAHYHFSDHHTESGIHYFTTPSINTYPCRFAVFELTSTTLSMRTYLVGEEGEHQAEAAAIRTRAKAEIVKAEDWAKSITQGLKDLGKPYDEKSMQTRLRAIFEAASSVPALPLRAAASQ